MSATAFARWDTVSPMRRSLATTWRERRSISAAAPSVPVWVMMTGTVSTSAVIAARVRTWPSMTVTSSPVRRARIGSSTPCSRIESTTARNWSVSVSTASRTFGPRTREVGARRINASPSTASAAASVAGVAVWVGAFMMGVSPDRIFGETPGR